MARPKSNRLTLTRLNQEKNLRKRIKLLRERGDEDILYSKGILKSLDGNQKVLDRLRRKFKKEDIELVDLFSDGPNEKTYQKIYKQKQLGNSKRRQRKANRNKEVEVMNVFDNDFDKEDTEIKDVFDDDFEVNVDNQDTYVSFANKMGRQPTKEDIDNVYKELKREIEKLSSDNVTVTLSYKTMDGAKHYRSFKYTQEDFKRVLFKMITLIFTIYEPTYETTPDLSSFKFFIRNDWKKTKMTRKFNMRKTFEQYRINQFIMEEDAEKVGKHCFVYEFCKASGHDYDKVWAIYLKQFGDVPANEEQISFIEKFKGIRVRIHIFDINGILIRDGTNTLRTIEKNVKKKGCSNVIGLVWHNNHCWGFKHMGTSLTKMVKQGRANNLQVIPRLIKREEKSKGRRLILNNKIYDQQRVNELEIILKDIHEYHSRFSDEEQQIIGSMVVLHTQTILKERCYQYLKGVSFNLYKNSGLCIYIGKIVYNFIQVPQSISFEDFMDADDKIGISAYNSYPEWGMNQLRQLGDISRLRVNTDMNIYDMIKDTPYTWTRIVNTRAKKGCMVDFSSAYLLASLKRPVFDFDCQNKVSEIIPLERPILSNLENLPCGFYYVRYREKESCKIPLMKFKEDQCLIPHQLVDKMLETRDYDIYLFWFIPLEKQTNIFRDLLGLNNKLKKETKELPYARMVVKTGLLATIGMLYRKSAPEKELTTNNLTEISHLINNQNTDIEIIRIERDDGESILKEEAVDNKIFIQTLEFDNDKTGEEYAYTLKFKDNTPEDRRVVAPHLSAQLYALHSINMYDLTKALMEQGCKINAYHVDSIAVSFTDEFFKFDEDFLRKWNVKVERTFENARFIRYNQTVYNENLEDEERTLICNDDDRNGEHVEYWTSDINEVVPYFDDRLYDTEKELIKPKIKIYNLEGGAGKSHQIRELIANDAGIIATSTTGVSALNIDKNCMTIDRFMGRTMDGYQKPEEMKHYSKILSSHSLIIDEFSMLGKNKFELLNRRLQTLRRDNRPFGGMNLILYGDTKQLQPVKDSLITEANIWDLVEIEKFSSKRTDPNYRFKDEGYRNFNWELREGKTDVAYMRNLVGPEPSLEEIMNGVTFISYTNKVVKQKNSQILDKLQGEEIKFGVMKRKTVGKEEDGKKIKEWTDLSDKEFQAFLTKYPVDLEFKVGCKVMCRSNISPTLRNGTVVTLLNETTVLHANGKEEKIKYETRDGVYRYMPFCLAYAMTCHKTQGLTLDRIYCDTLCFKNVPEKDRFRYVLFSRVRRPQDIRISRVF